MAIVNVESFLSSRSLMTVVARAPTTKPTPIIVTKEVLRARMSVARFYPQLFDPSLRTTQYPVHQDSVGLGRYLTTILAANLASVFARVRLIPKARPRADLRQDIYLSGQIPRRTCQYR